jgi:hypothetical protein
VERLVKPERLEKNDKAGREKWWQFLRIRKEMYEAISKVDQVMAMNRHSKYTIISPVNKGIVYSEATVVFALNNYSKFAFLSSTIHDIWAWKNSSTMGSSTLRYSASKAFETFPFPQLLNERLETLGYELSTFRQKLMLEYQIGLTELYNRYHSSSLDLIQLYAIHCEIDNIIISAYNWDDLNLRHDFYEVDYLPENDRERFTIHPKARKEVLKRLFLLNHKLHKEEQIEASSKKEKRSKINIHKSLFSDSE